MNFQDPLARDLQIVLALRGELQYSRIEAVTVLIRHFAQVYVRYLPGEIHGLLLQCGAP